MAVGVAAKSISPVVTAEGKIGDAAFTDVNQTARPIAQANPDQPTLIADRVATKIEATGKPLPNGNMADAHAEIRVIKRRRSGAKATSIEFLLKATRNSAGKIEADITQSSAIKTLESNGYTKTISQDGSVTVLTNGGKTYRFYPSSTSTGQPSASLTVERVKKPTARIGFLGEEHDCFES